MFQIRHESSHKDSLTRMDSGRLYTLFSIPRCHVLRSLPLIVLLDLDLLDATEIHPESLSAATSEHTSITLSQCGTGTVSLAVLSDTSTVAQYDLTSCCITLVEKFVEVVNCWVTKCFLTIDGNYCLSETFHAFHACRWSHTVFVVVLNGRHA